MDGILALLLQVSCSTVHRHLHAELRPRRQRPPLTRWWCILASWYESTVLANVWPVCLVAALLAAGIASLPQALLPRVSPLPLSLQGTAIGLLLVFRTNNSYLRLSEARELWGRAIVLCREIAQSVVIASTCAERPAIGFLEASHEAAAKNN